MIPFLRSLRLKNLTAKSAKEERKGRNGFVRLEFVFCYLEFDSTDANPSPCAIRNAQLSPSIAADIIPPA